MFGQTFRRGMAALVAVGGAGAIAAVPHATQAAATPNGSLLSTHTGAGQFLDRADGTARVPFRWRMDIAADFDPTGTRITRSDGRYVSIRSSNGALFQFPSDEVAKVDALTQLRWANDGSYLVASTTSASGVQALWRYAPGHKAVKIVQQQDANERNPFQLDIDPQSGRVVYIDGGDLWSVDPERPGSASRLTSNCSPSPFGPVISCDSMEYVGLSSDPNGGRVLVLYRYNDPDAEFTAHAALGWYSPGAAKPTLLRELPLDSNPQDPMVSPDGNYLAWNTNVPSRTLVAPVNGGTAVTLPGGQHVAWQPCPDARCPEFVAPPLIHKPHIGRATSGAPGSPSTLAASWTRPGNSVAANLIAYELRVGRVNAAGHVVSTRNLYPPVDGTKTSKRIRIASGPYRVRVRAHGSGGRSPWSAWSNVATAR